MLNDASRGMTRILHLINGEHYAGAERVQDLLALRLPELGYEVSFACTRLNSFARVRRAESAPLYSTYMRHKLDLSPVPAIVGLVRREGYALLHAHTVRTAMIGALVSRWTGVPLVYHMHSPASRETTRRWSNWANVVVERLSLRQASMTIAVSESLGRYALADGIPANRLAVVPNGVPTLGSLPRRDPPRGGWTLGMVALFRPRKGLEVLLEALALLQQAGHDVRLRAIGAFETPAYRAEIDALVERLGIGGLIEWRGFRSDVVAELEPLDLFVLPSLFGEGMPMVVLEAMAAGVPVVASGVEGIPEALRNGTDGLIVRAGDPRDLATTVTRLIAGEHDWSALRTAAHARQLERFSDCSMALGVARVYDRLLSRRRIEEPAHSTNEAPLPTVWNTWPGGSLESPAAF